MTEVFTEARLDEALEAILAMDAPREEKLARLDEVKALWAEAGEARRIAAAGALRENSVRFLKLLDRMLGEMEALSRRAGLLSTATVETARAELGELHSQLHDREGLAKTHAAGPQVLQVVNDEAETPGVDEARPLPPEAETLETPTPMDSARYVALADEYVRFYLGAALRPSHESKVEAFADLALSSRARYAAVGDPLGIPWWFIAAIHMLESTNNFTTHLHNGDPLRNRTFRVPSGQPERGQPPFSWEESATDALKRQKLDGLSDWSLPRALWRWERYNGFGYRKRGVPTPYLWSFSTIYLRGKYVADGRFDGGATSAQCGAATLLKALQRRGAVDPGVDVVEEDREETLTAEVAAVPLDQPAVEDEGAIGSHRFRTFVERNIPGLRHFTWREFLTKGAQHAQNGLNDDPPEDLWPNLVPLARFLDEFRERMGQPVRIHSCYRSPAYNRSIGGSAKRSQHMAFRAADVSVGGASPGSPGDWAAALRELRAAHPEFEGGIGLYDSFVHVDTRGVRANWDNRG